MYITIEFLQNPWTWYVLSHKDQYLGPLLFTSILYINALPNSRKKMLKVIMFVDASVYACVRNLSDLTKAVNNDLKLISLTGSKLTNCP